MSPTKGKQLHLTALAIGAKRILEVGTLGGYSTIWMARALPADGELVSLEIDAKHADVARSNIARAKPVANVEVITGKAIDTLPRPESPFDLAFIDADKESNADYFAHALRMSRARARRSSSIMSCAAGRLRVPKATARRRACDDCST